MAILIMGLKDALKFVPENPTYAIRIRNSDITDQEFATLQKSNLYYAINEYVFDDIDHWEKYRSGVIFTATIAEKIVRDFQGNRRNSQDLLVHCRAGINRSPALALGMNRIFNLGANEEEIISKHKYGTWWMADRLIDSAKEIGLIPESVETFNLDTLLESEDE